MNPEELTHLWESYLKLRPGALGAKAPKHPPPEPMGGLNGWVPEPAPVELSSADVEAVQTQMAADYQNHLQQEAAALMGIPAHLLEPHYTKAKPAPPAPEPTKALIGHVKRRIAL